MALDLSCTKDPEWIAQREALWPKWQAYLSDPLLGDLNRKEIKQCHSYYLTGKTNRFVSTIYAYLFMLCPVRTKESFAELCANFLDPSDFNFDLRFQSVIYTFFKANAWVDLEPHQQLSLFKMVFGERYEPNRKFPFLINGEAEYRPIFGDATSWLLTVQGSFKRNLHFEANRPCSELHLQCLRNYFFSIYPYIDEQLFDVELFCQVENRETKDLPKNVIAFVKTMESFFSTLIYPPETSFEYKFIEGLEAQLQPVRDFFESQTFFSKLSELWQWAQEKYRPGKVSISFSVSDDSVELWRELLDSAAKSDTGVGDDVETKANAIDDCVFQSWHGVMDSAYYSCFKEWCFMDGRFNFTLLLNSSQIVDVKYCINELELKGYSINKLEQV